MTIKMEIMKSKYVNDTLKTIKNLKDKLLKCKT